jgi:hypothetical protein
VNGQEKEKVFNMAPISTELFVVMDGNKIGGLYRWRNDASAHAQVVGGAVVIQQVRTEIPGWVKTMIDAAVDKAQMQSAGERR